ncbi:VOC family protein [Streptomyces sp. NPDC051907]|uniref:VOC family protein n=1 Tax=Streptomyces sp. NPDC051907 TaxID=3155284 RepID=UPI003435EBE2
MELTLEVVMLPVTDVDRARDFYRDKLGFAVDTDTQISDTARIVQLTPPGSRCSIAMGTGFPEFPGQKAAAPGSVQGLQLCVTDIEAAYEELTSRGLDVTKVQHLGATGWEDGKGETWNAFMSFKDPDGNGWVIQEAPAPLSER